MISILHTTTSKNRTTSLVVVKLVMMICISLNPFRSALSQIDLPKLVEAQGFFDGKYLSKYNDDDNEVKKIFPNALEWSFLWDSTGRVQNDLLSIITYEEPYVVNRVLSAQSKCFGSGCYEGYCILKMEKYLVKIAEIDGHGVAIEINMNISFSSFLLSNNRLKIKGRNIMRELGEGNFRLISYDNRENWSVVFNDSSGKVIYNDYGGWIADSQQDNVSLSQAKEYCKEQGKKAKDYMNSNGKLAAALVGVGFGTIAAIIVTPETIGTATVPIFVVASTTTGATTLWVFEQLASYKEIVATQDCLKQYGIESDQPEVPIEIAQSVDSQDMFGVLSCPEGSSLQPVTKCDTSYYYEEHAEFLGDTDGDGIPEIKVVAKKKVMKVSCQSTLECAAD